MKDEPKLEVISQLILDEQMKVAKIRDDQIQQLILARLAGLKCALVETRETEGFKFTTTFRFEFEEKP